LRRNDVRKVKDRAARFEMTEGSV